MGVSASSQAAAKAEEEPFADHVTEPHSEFQRTPTDFDPQAEVARAQEQGWIALAGVMYENAVKAIIRPPRDVYGSRELGPTEFRFRGRAFIRKDFVLKNPRGMRLQCSHWMPADAERPSPRLPCVVCLHGNSSSRVSAKFNLEVVLNEGATLMAIDFAGSGRSEGRWVTLGWWEKDDLATVLQHLREEGRTSSIALWGRSMGAATALLQVPRDPLIDCIVVDSPFADLQQLIEEIVERFRAQAGLTLPSWITGSVVRMVQTSVFKRTSMDIMRLKPLASAHLCHVRALFTAGRDDEFVPPHHATAIFESYAGPKDLVLLDGQDHNSQRPPFFQARVGNFLRDALHIPAPARLYRDDELVEHPQLLRVAWAVAFSAGAVSHRPPTGVIAHPSAGASASAGAAAGGSRRSSAEAAAADDDAAAGGIDPTPSFGLDQPLPDPIADPLQHVIEQSKVTFRQEQRRREEAAAAAAAAAGAADGDDAPAAFDRDDIEMRRHGSATSAVMGSASFRRDLDDEAGAGEAGPAGAWGDGVAAAPKEGEGRPAEPSDEAEGGPGADDDDVLAGATPEEQEEFRREVALSLAAHRGRPGHG